MVPAAGRVHGESGWQSPSTIWRNQGVSQKDGKIANDQEYSQRSAKCPCGHSEYQKKGFSGRMILFPKVYEKNPLVQCGPIP